MAYRAEVMETETLTALEDQQIPYNRKPVDLVHLSRQTFGSKDLEAEVLNLFLSHSLCCLQRLQAATTDQQWIDAAHSIKGSARAIGAWEVGDLAEQFEQQAIAGLLGEKAEASRAIEQAVSATNDYIRTLVTDAA